LRKKELRHAARGAKFTVVYACDAAGRYPAEEFLQELANDPARKSEHAGVLHLLQLFADAGKISNPEHFKKLEGTDPTLVEFKKFQTRVIGFFNGAGQLVLTHGFIKKKDKVDKAEFQRAYRIRIEHLA
jgi:hypothetical protein